MKRVFVGNLPKDIVESELRVALMDIVRKISPKTQIIKVRRASGNPHSHSLSQIFLPRPFRGYAFVTLDNPKVAVKLIKRRDLLLTIDGQEHKCFANAAEHKTPDNRGGVGMMMQRGGGHIGGDFDALPQRAGMWAPTPGMQQQHGYSMPSYGRVYQGCFASNLTRIVDVFGGVAAHMTTSAMGATGYGHQLQSSSISGGGYQPAHQSPYGAPQQQQHSYMPQSSGAAPAQQFGGWSSSGGFGGELRCLQWRT
jgi:hypothetical protein